MEKRRAAGSGSDGGSGGGGSGSSGGNAGGGSGEGGITVMFTNAQSIVNKVDELRALVAMTKPDVIALTETWTNDSIGNDYLTISDYEIVVRKDREDTDRGRGGGITGVL